MHRTIHTAPGWTPAVAVRLAKLGVRSVTRKKNGRVYVYRYLRFDVATFPETINARRIRLVVVPPDFTAPPIIITARLSQRGKRAHGFVVDGAYQRIVADYARGGHIGVIAVETIEFEKEVGTPRL
ncbi:MAG: hypothetical protein LM577_07905 [Thermoproteaceae archaeon]|nr:hypothetical protein [Thermoproteaceae archaeon]